LEKCALNQKVHLCLAHLVEQDPEYREFYSKLDDTHRIILDNSGFEMFKQGKPMMEPDKLIDIGKTINADTIVLSDYPGEPAQKTIDAAELLIPQFKAEGIGTFFVPQSEFGDIDQYLDCVQYGLNHPDIDLIGLSILGCPNAFGVESSNNLQRFLSRLELFSIMEYRGMLKQEKTFHCLGLLDGPNEVSLLKQFHKYIYSWDSSSAPWAAISGVSYDQSPTGLMDGKIETEVDFNVPFDSDCVPLIKYNTFAIDSQC